MNFPDTNKQRQPLSDKFGENAELLAKKIGEINWRLFAKVWAFGLSILAITLFVIVASVKLAVSIF